MDGLYLTAEQIEAGAATLSNLQKLKGSQIDDILSIWRGFLGNLASNYPLRSTLENVQDDAENNRAAKLAACLLLWQDVQFDVTAFVATNANRTGFTDSAIGERYDIFLYTFGLFWDIPSSLLKTLTGQNSNFASSQTVSRRINK